MRQNLKEPTGLVWARATVDVQRSGPRTVAFIGKQTKTETRKTEPTKCITDNRHYYVYCPANDRKVTHTRRRVAIKIEEHKENSTGIALTFKLRAITITDTLRRMSN